MKYYSAIILTAIIVLTMFYAMRYINQAISPVTTFSPADGIVCVQVSSTDGVALSCVVKP